MTEAELSRTMIEWEVEGGGFLKREKREEGEEDEEEGG